MPGPEPLDGAGLRVRAIADRIAGAGVDHPDVAGAVEELRALADELVEDERLEDELELLEAAQRRLEQRREVEKEALERDLARRRAETDRRVRQYRAERAPRAPGKPWRVVVTDEKKEE